MKIHCSYLIGKNALSLIFILQYWHIYKVERFNYHYLGWTHRFLWAMVLYFYSCGAIRRTWTLYHMARPNVLVEGQYFPMDHGSLFLFLWPHFYSLKLWLVSWVPVHKTVMRYVGSRQNQLTWQKHGTITLCRICWKFKAYFASLYWVLLPASFAPYFLRKNYNLFVKYIISREIVNSDFTVEWKMQIFATLASNAYIYIF